MNNVIEVGSPKTDGAKINLTIDLAPEDCYIMCKQLFDKLKDNEKDDIIKAYKETQEDLKQ